MKRTRILSLIFAIVSVQLTFAQFEPPMAAFPSPEAAGLGIYGQVPVGLYTGVPDISIPIHDFRVKNISIPIALRYHIGSVKPNLHPGWVGLGWNLSAGGCITREVNCNPDELMTSSGVKGGYLGHYADLNKTDWYSTANINNYQKSIYPDYKYEMLPDEFSFNFCGYSGSFYLDHTGKWQVKSDVDIKVLFDENKDCIGIRELRSNIAKGMNEYRAQGTNSRLINEITLVTPDGIKYKFGGKEATEYTIPYFAQASSYLIATSWFLTEITSQEGYVVTLKYISGDPVCEMKPFYTEASTPNGHLTGCLTRANEDCRDAQLIFPVYLEKICYIDSERGGLNKFIHFISSVRGDLRVPNNLLNLDLPFNLPFSNRNIYYLEREYQNKRNVFIKSPDELKWRKLISIQILDGTLSKSVIFKYVDTPTKRLWLVAFSPAGMAGGVYHFAYNRTDATSWPDYFTDQEDHWGFFNRSGELASSINVNSYTSHREPSFSLDVRKEEVLKSITYPTGGSVAFEYEANDYSRYISNNNELIGEKWSCDTGGLRVKQISKRTKEGILESSDSYYYKKEIQNLSDTTNAQLVSSGILAKKVKYIFDVPNPVNPGLKLFSSGAISPYLYNTDGSHIGYSQVMEVKKNGFGQIIGYKKYRFTNYQDDVSGAGHLNEPPLLTSYPDKALACHTDKSMERGKLAWEAFYSADGKLQKTISYQYINVLNDCFVRNLQLGRYFIGRANNVNSYLSCMTAYKVYTGSYLLNERTEEIYGNAGGSITTKLSYQYDHFRQLKSSGITTKLSYQYDHFRQLKSSGITVSAGKNLQTEYIYPYDITTDAICKKMIDRHLIHQPVERITTISQKNRGSIVHKERFTFAEQNTKLFLYRYEKALNNSSEYVETYRCEKTDRFGNPVSVFMRGEPEQVYIWTNAYLTPLAVIRNAKYSEVINLLGGEQAFNNIGYDKSEIIPQKVLNLPQLLPEAEVSIYKYSKYSQRLWEQAPNGLNTTYRYGSMGRLTQIIDHKNNIVKQWDYGFSNW